MLVVYEALNVLNKFVTKVSDPRLKKQIMVAAMYMYLMSTSEQNYP
jgi:hypothetical protein